MTLKSISLLLIGAMSMIPTLALSQQRPEGFSLGLATVANDSPFVGGDASISFLPILGYDSQAFSVGVLQGLRVTALDRDDFRLSLIAAPRFFLEIADTDGDALDGIERNITGEAGVSLEYTLGRATEISLRAVQEFTDEHGGQELVLDVRQRVPLGSFPLVIGGGLRWQSEDHAEYAWGVKPEEATSTRPAYAPGDVLIPSISIGTFVPVSEKVRVIATVRMDFLPEEVYNSPIIDQENTVSAFIGVTRTF